MPLVILLASILVTVILLASIVPLVILLAFKFFTATLLASIVPVVILPPSTTVVPPEPNDLIVTYPDKSIFEDTREIVLSVNVKLVELLPLFINQSIFPAV